MPPGLKAPHVSEATSEPGSPVSCGQPLPRSHKLQREYRSARCSKVSKVPLSPDADASKAPLLAAKNDVAADQSAPMHFPPGWRPATYRVPMQALPKISRDHDAVRVPSQMTEESKDQEPAKMQVQSLASGTAQPCMVLTGQDKSAGAPGSGMPRQVAASLPGLPSVSDSSQTEHLMKRVPSTVTPPSFQQVPESPNAAANQSAKASAQDKAYVHKAQMDTTAAPSVQGLAQRVSQETQALLSENAALKQAHVKVVAERDAKEAELVGLRDILEKLWGSVEAARSASST